jgi:dihydrofolate synthase/folylpolyglutamate synthase
MAVLGDTLSKIAYEKAGIIKPGRPVVVAPQKDEALRVVQQVAEERLSSLTVLGHDYHYASLDHSLANQRLYVWADEDQDRMDAFIEGQSQEWSPVELSIPLLGYHQIENAATAYAALQIIHKEGIQVSLENILAGFAGVFWPGRFEVLRQNPPVIVDSAHNRDSALKLRLALEDYLPGKQVVLLFGVSEDKDVEGIFAELLPRVKRVVATESIHPRAMKADDLVKMVHRYGRPAESILPIEAALERALEIAGNDSAVLVTGSLFIAAGARDAWKILGYPLREFSSLPITKG